MKDKSISGHREKKNAAILAEMGARLPTIRGLTRKESAVNYNHEKTLNLEVSKSLKLNASSRCPEELARADHFIKIFNNINKKIGNNYSRSQRFIQAYMTYKDCLGTIETLNINSCYRVLEDTIKAHWFTDTCRECKEEFGVASGELMCPSCIKVKQISCSRCDGPNDRYKSERTRGHPYTLCSSCKNEDQKIIRARLIS